MKQGCLAILCCSHLIVYEPGHDLRFAELPDATAFADGRAEKFLQECDGALQGVNLQIDRQALHARIFESKDTVRPNLRKLLIAYEANAGHVSNQTSGDVNGP